MSEERLVLDAVRRKFHPPRLLAALSAATVTPCFTAIASSFMLPASQSLLIAAQSQACAEFSSSAKEMLAMLKMRQNGNQTA